MQGGEGLIKDEKAFLYFKMFRGILISFKDFKFWEIFKIFVGKVYLDFLIGIIAD